MIRKRKYEDVLTNPSTAYKSPRDVILDNCFNKEQKISILEQWEIDSRELLVASEEGMNGGEDSQLKQVRDILRNLVDENKIYNSPTKQGR